MRVASESHDEGLLAAVNNQPGITAKEAGASIGISSAVAGNRLLNLFQRGLVGRLKVRSSLKYYGTQEEADRRAIEVFAEDERARRARPVSTIAGFSGQVTKARPKPIPKKFSDSIADYSKAKTTVLPSAPGRYSVDPGFRGEFMREWEERRRT